MYHRRQEYEEMSDDGGNNPKQEREAGDGGASDDDEDDGEEIDIGQAQAAEPTLPGSRAITPPEHEEDDEIEDHFQACSLRMDDIPLRTQLKNIPKIYLFMSLLLQPPRRSRCQAPAPSVPTALPAQATPTNWSSSRTGPSPRTSARGRPSLRSWERRSSMGQLCDLILPKTLKTSFLSLKPP